MHERQMWSRMKHMSCASIKVRNQAVKGDLTSTNLDLPSRSQTPSPGPSAADRATSRRISEEEEEREDAPWRKSANSSPDTSSKQKHAFIRGKRLRLDTRGLPVTTPGTLSSGVDLTEGFEAATTHTTDYKRMKLTGNGAPGSHSALFGLTPNGHKEDEADYSSPKLTRVQSAVITSAPNFERPEDAKASDYQHTISHSALFGLIPDKPKESEANQSSSKTELAQSDEDTPSSSSDRPADAGTLSHRHTVSHSALFGLIPDGLKENQANKLSSKSEPAHGAEAIAASSRSPAPASPVAVCSGAGMSIRDVMSPYSGELRANADTSDRDAHLTG